MTDPLNLFPSLTSLPASADSRSPLRPSWPTPTVKSGAQHKDTPTAGQTGGTTLGGEVRAQERAWPTVRASDCKGVDPIGSKSQAHMEARGYLSAIVNAEEDGPPSPVTGPLDPANNSTTGSRPELPDWPTPATRDHHAQGANHNPAAQSSSLATVIQKKGESWATPQAHDAQGPKTPAQIEAMRAKGHGVKNLNEQAAWATPTQDDANNASRESGAFQSLTRQAGKLNPSWVESLMGFPLGFTQLPYRFKKGKK
jgi:hypothetical protein